MLFIHSITTPRGAQLGEGNAPMLVNEISNLLVNR
jgi:hypothetical protein